MNNNFKRVHDKLRKQLTEEAWNLVTDQVYQKAWKTSLYKLYFSVREQVWHRVGEPIAQVRDRHGN